MDRVGQLFLLGLFVSVLGNPSFGVSTQKQAGNMTATPSPSPSPSPSSDGETCAYHHAHDKCAYVKSHDACAGTLINYLELYACSDKKVPLTIAYVLWMMLVFYLLGTTADKFFCPHLEELSDRLHLSPRVAGVTLLSLGNGAPDIFSSIAATRDNHLDLVIGDLSGGGMFVCSVVAGGVLTVANNLSTPPPLLRDMAFYLVAIVGVCVCLRLHWLNIIPAVIMLVFYLFYVGVVFGTDQQTRQQLKRSLSRDKLQEDEGARRAGGDDNYHAAVTLASTLASPETNVAPLPITTRDILLGFIIQGIDWIEFPFTVARHLTIANAGEASWSKSHLSRLNLAISVALTPLLFGFWQGVLNSKVHNFPLWGILLIGGFVVGVVVFLTCPADQPPKYSVFMLVIGFLSAAVWIDVFATELVEVLTAVGLILHISNIVLGATVLAWGNCVGDLTADCLMARNGRQNMAITACYAGPLFNLLIGVGVGVLNNPKVHTTLDPAAAMSFGALAGLLTVTILMSVLFRFQLPAWFAYILWAFYCAYMVALLVLELS